RATAEALAAQRRLAELDRFSAEESSTRVPSLRAFCVAAVLQPIVINRGRSGLKTNAAGEQS
ncbi:MAG TPA: hypothetical protein VIL65_12780, partial [Beijerinckiaceae bacterium]